MADLTKQSRMLRIAIPGHERDFKRSTELFICTSEFAHALTSNTLDRTMETPDDLIRRMHTRIHFVFDVIIIYGISRSGSKAESSAQLLARYQMPNDQLPEYDVSIRLGMHRYDHDDDACSNQSIKGPCQPAPCVCVGAVAQSSCLLRLEWRIRSGISFILAGMVHMIACAFP